MTGHLAGKQRIEIYANEGHVEGPVNFLVLQWKSIYSKEHRLLIKSFKKKY